MCLQKGNPHHHRGPASGLSQGPGRKEHKRWARRCPNAQSGDRARSSPEFQGLPGPAGIHNAASSPAEERGARFSRCPHHHPPGAGQAPSSRCSGRWEGAPPGPLWGDETNVQGRCPLNGHAATGGPGPLGPLTPVLQTATPSQPHAISAREAKGRYHQDDGLNVVSTLACVSVMSDSGRSPGGGHGNPL